MAPISIPFQFAPVKVINSPANSVGHTKPMRRLRVICLLAFLICLTISAAANAKPRSFHELVDAYFDDYFKANPSQATNVGFHQYDRQLEDFSLAAHQRNRRKLVEYLAAFQAINPRTLSALERDDREIM